MQRSFPAADYRSVKCNSTGHRAAGLMYRKSPHFAPHAAPPTSYSRGWANLSPRLPNFGQRASKVRDSTNQQSASSATTPGASFKAKVVDMFDKRAAVYDTGNVYHVPMAEMLVARADLKPGERVLDMATGTGFVALSAAAVVGRTGSVLGVDLSSAMLEQAAAKARAQGLSQTTFTQGDVEALDFEPGSFDAIFCATALMYMTDTAGLLKKTLSWLAPGGRLLFNAFESPQNPTYGIFCEVARKYGVVVEDPTEATGRPEKCEALLRAVGYTNITVDVEDSKQEFKTSMDEYVERIWRLSTTGPWHVLSELTDADTAARIKEEFVHLAVEETLRSHTTEDGIVFPVKVYYVKGVKEGRPASSSHASAASLDRPAPAKAWSNTGLSSPFAARHPSLPLRGNQPSRWSSLYPGFSGSTDDEPTEVELIFQEWLQKEQDYRIEDSGSDTDSELPPEAGTTIDWDQYAAVPFIPDIPFTPQPPSSPFPYLTPQLAGNAGGSMLASALPTTTSITPTQTRPSAEPKPNTTKPSSSVPPKTSTTPPAQPGTRGFSPRGTATSAAATAPTSLNRSPDKGVNVEPVPGRLYVPAVAAADRPSATRSPVAGSSMSGAEQLLADGEKLLMDMESGDEEAMLLRVQRWAERDDLAQRQRELLAKLARKLQRSGMRKGKYEAEPYTAGIRDPLQFVKPAIVVLMIPFVALMFAMLHGFQGAPI